MTGDDSIDIRVKEGFEFFLQLSSRQPLPYLPKLQEENLLSLGQHSRNSLLMCRVSWL